MLGFGPIGVLAVGTGPGGSSTSFILNVTAASYVVTANAVSFKTVDNISPAAFVVAAQGVTLQELEAVSANSFAVTTQAVSFKFNEPVAAASYALNTVALVEKFKEPVAAASFALSTTAPSFAFNWPIASAAFAATFNALTVDTTILTASYVLTGHDVALTVIQFGSVGDGGRSHNAEDDWDNHRRKLQALRQSIRQARRRVEGGTPVRPRAPLQANTPETSTPLQIPHVDLDFKKATATLHDIAAHLSALESALQQRSQPTQVAPDPVAAPNNRDEDDAITALLMVA